MATVGDLEAYAKSRSSALLALAAQILGGMGAEIAAGPAGMAYAIAGLLRAFPLHAARRQLYVPIELLDRHKVRQQDIFAGKGLGRRQSGAFRSARARARPSARGSPADRGAAGVPSSPLFFRLHWCGLRSIAWSAAIRSRRAKSRLGGGNGSSGARRVIRRGSRGDRRQSMIRKSGNRFSDKIMLQ